MKSRYRALALLASMAASTSLVACGEDAVSIEGLCPDLGTPYDLRKATDKPKRDAVNKSCVTGIGTAPTQPPTGTGGGSSTGGAGAMPEAGALDAAPADAGAD